VSFKKKTDKLTFAKKIYLRVVTTLISCNLVRSAIQSINYLHFPISQEILFNFALRINTIVHKITMWLLIRIPIVKIFICPCPDLCRPIWTVAIVAMTIHLWLSTSVVATISWFSTIRVILPRHFCRSTNARACRGKFYDELCDCLSSRKLSRANMIERALNNKTIFF